MTGRHELKFYINYADFLQLRSRLPCIAKQDEHGAAMDGYRVRSLYFDNYSDKALREKIDGINEREKFRIRFYDEDTTFIRLEKKSKCSGLCYKQSAMISEQLCQQILNGEYGGLQEQEDPLLQEFYIKVMVQQLRPKNIVDYRRQAYVYPPGNVRITFDYEIRSGLDTNSFLSSAGVMIPIAETIILEVKYDAFLPEVIRGLITLSSRQHSAFSKYAVTRLI